MAYYANAKGGIPFHKREEDRRWKDHIAKHQKNMQSIKPSVANKNDLDKHIHMRLKLKKLQIQEDRIATIEYQNRRLLKNITRIERKPNTEFWNEKFIKKEKKQKGLESSEESSESESEEPGSSSDDDFEAREERKLEREQRKIQRQQRKDDRQAKRDAALEHFHRMGMLEELKAGKSLEENKKLERRLQQMLKKFQEEKKTSTIEDDNIEERIRAIKEAQNALKKENEVMEDRSQLKVTPRERSDDDHDERRREENKRLHKKLLDIQKGKGKKKPTDPEFDGMKRWWVTSPRGKDKSEYERERQKFIEENKLARQQKKIERTQEEKELMKKQKEESRRDSVPDGYRKKRRKKKDEVEEAEAEVEKEDEDLPDTSIIAKDPYGDNSTIAPEDSTKKKKPKKKLSPYKEVKKSPTKGKGPVPTVLERSSKKNEAGSHKGAKKKK